MAEEILPNIFKIKIALPSNLLEDLNSYLIRTETRSLLIDTGMNTRECRYQMVSELKKLNVDLNNLDFFITHFHIDHIGLLESLTTKTSKIYFNQYEANLINNKKYSFQNRWKELRCLYLSSGFLEDEYERLLEDRPASMYNLNEKFDFSIINDGEVIQIGDFIFKCVQTPGHSPGHMCLYENKRKILISGDHILLSITPNIGIWPYKEEFLYQYFKSLDKIYSLDVRLILPGHGRIWADHRKRIDEIRRHHDARFYEIITSLRDGEKTAYQIASSITWNFCSGSWELFPPLQKWFAVGETLAHLKFLTRNRTVRANRKRNNILFYLV